MAHVPMIRGGSYGIPAHPFQIDQITAYGFAVNASMAALQALVDATLNATGSSLRFFVISPQVLFTFMRMGCLRSETNPGVGFYRETELNVTLMLAGGSLQSPVRIYWYMPYLWIDTPTPQLAGRDIFGYPKQIGHIDMPADLGAPAQFCVTGEGLEPHAPGTCAGMMPVIRARRTDGDLLEQSLLSVSVDEAVGTLFEHVLDVSLGGLGGLAGTIANALGLDKLLRLVFLRQLPSIEDPGKAAYQSLATTPFSVTGFRGAGLLQGDYVVEFPSIASLNLPATLGLGGGGAGPVQVAAKTGYFMDFDMRLARGSELWVAS